MKLIKMERNGKPANVHPKEVEAYRKAGYVEVKSKAKPSKKNDTNN